jgi:Rod binding domain-containing protein
MDYQVSQALSEYRIDGLTDPQSLKRLAQIGDKRVRAEAVAQQLETVFFGMVMKAMRATVPDGALDGKGLGRSQYVQMLDQQYAELAGMPRDPRFHEALVRQILADPAETGRLLDQMRQTTAAQPAAQRRVGTNPTGEVQASEL